MRPQRMAQARPTTRAAAVSHGVALVAIMSDGIDEVDRIDGFGEGGRR